jgi:tetratricopeptide (TPR) repeat protein
MTDVTPRRLRLRRITQLLLLTAGAVAGLKIAHTRAIKWLPKAISSADPGLTTWLMIAAAMCAGISALADISGYLRTRRHESRENSESILGVQQALRLHRRGRACRVRHVTSPFQAGASRIVHSHLEAFGKVYLPVSADLPVREVLESSVTEFLLIKGEPLAGKTRTAYEAVAATRPKAQFVWPEPKGGIGELRRLGVDLSQSVVWLDSLELYLPPFGDMSLSDLTWLLGQRGLTIVGTIDSSHYSILSNDPITRPILNGAIVVDLPVLRSVPISAQAQYGIDSAILEEIGLGEYLSSDPEALGRCLGNLDQGSTFILNALADLYLMGLVLPMTRTEIESILDKLASLMSLPTQGLTSLLQSLDEATLSLNQRPLVKVSLSIGVTLYRPSPALLRWRSDTAGVPNDLRLANLVQCLSVPHQLLEVTFRGSEKARRLMTVRIAQLGREAEPAERAGIQAIIGFAAMKRGATREVETAFRKAYSLEENPSNALNLANFYTRQKDLDTGAKWLQLCVDRWSFPPAASQLLLINSRRGQAVNPLLVELATQDPSRAASHDVGEMLAQEQGAATARRWHEKRMAWGDPHSQLHVALMDDELGDLTTAGAKYAAAARSWDTDAIRNYAAFLWRSGHRRAAQPAFERARRLGDKRSAHLLGLLFESQGDRAKALTAYEIAASMGSVDASTSLGKLLLEVDRPHEAMPHLRAAEKRGDATARHLLVAVLGSMGKSKSARRVARRGDASPGVQDDVLLEQLAAVPPWVLRLMFRVARAAHSLRRRSRIANRLIVKYGPRLHAWALRTSKN